MPLNNDFNAQMQQIHDPFVTYCLPRLSAKDLFTLTRTSKIFRHFVLNDPASKTRVEKFRKALTHTYQLPQAWLKSKTPLSYSTLLKVAEWLRNKGNIPIPPNGISPTKYVEAIDNEADDSQETAHDIYYQMWRLHNAGNTDPRYGEKAFYDENPFSSTPEEKAQAIENSVLNKTSELVE